jgi:hypothetical protein
MPRGWWYTSEKIVGIVVKNTGSDENEGQE